MKECGVVLSASAEAHLAAIHDYLVERADRETAQRVVDELIDRCLGLATFPNRGTLHDELGEGVRTVPFRRSATIGYVVAANDIVIVGVAWRGQRLEESIGWNR